MHRNGIKTVQLKFIPHRRSMCSQATMYRTSFILFKLLLIVIPGQLQTVDETDAMARYDNYRVYRMTPVNSDQLNMLNNMEATSDSFRFLQFPTVVDRAVDVMVPPHKLADFNALMNAEQMKPELLETNAQTVIDNERLNQMTRLDTSGLDWNNYHSLETIYKWMDDLVIRFPGQVELIMAGKTYENRDIRGIKLSKGPGNKGVFLEGGIHAREWISPATVTYILNQLLTSDDPAVQHISRKYDWYVVPVTNPDGYVYTYTKDRFWRKTRQPYGSCFGADPNRNWDNHWREAGASANPCQETFAGSKPFSERETETLARYLASLTGKLNIYLAFHSYSQLLLFPYGHTRNHTYNHDHLLQIGNAAAQSLSRRYGTQYDVGNIYEAIYPASGSSMEWAYDVVRAQVAFTYELRPKNSWYSGFILAPDQIIPTGEETVDSLVTLLSEAVKLGY